ncbi:MAG: PEP-utilizing enzyme [Ardenticatenaceae bacterium]|nr:PEP-utilizing enzyme [Ardenticatenaceae bacterium]
MADETLVAPEDTSTAAASSGNGQAAPAFGTDRSEVLATFYGDESFPIEWKDDEEKGRFWWYDDLHCPQPISPLWFDIGGWWYTCAYMYRRFGLPFGEDWIAKNINGYVYTSVVRPSDERAAQVGPYFGLVAGTYGYKFHEWWEERILPQTLRNMEYLDTFPLEEVSLPELMIHLEEALDIQEQHFRYHWQLNLSQFLAFVNFKNTFADLCGGHDADIEGDILLSLDDRNWDSIRALTRLRDKVADHPALQAAFEPDSGDEIIANLRQTEAGQRFLAEDIKAYQNEYGFKAMYTHEYAFETWYENPRPIIQGIKGYLVSDYDVDAEVEKTRQKRDAAIEEMWRRLQNEADRPKLQEALDVALLMAPLTPDHHFYYDQGTYARVRLVYMAVGRRFVQMGLLDDPEDIVYFKHDEIRNLAGAPDAEKARATVEERKETRMNAYSIRPRDWVGSASKWALYEEPYVGLWGYPGVFERSQSKQTEPADEVRGLAASPGVVEGTARVVASPAEFDQVREGDIMVCKMTNPAWVVVFTKIRGLVTDSGGVLAHPAVVAREFGIPAVVGCLDATHRIKNGDRVRVNGMAGTVTILS